MIKKYHLSFCLFTSSNHTPQTLKAQQAKILYKNASYILSSLTWRPEWLMLLIARTLEYCQPRRVKGRGKAPVSDVYVYCTRAQYIDGIFIQDFEAKLGKTLRLRWPQENPVISSGKKWSGEGEYMKGGYGETS